jgi:uncharacterized protein
MNYTNQNDNANGVNATSENLNDIINNILNSPEAAQSNQEGGFFWKSDADFGVENVVQAIDEGRANVAEYMIDNGADISSKIANGDTVLHRAIKTSVDFDNDYLIDRILETSNVSSLINAQDQNGDTPLITAVKANDMILCDRLVEAGADKSIKNNEGFHVDTETEVDTENVQQGGFFWSSQKSSSLDDKILRAAQEGNADVVEYLASHNMANDITGVDSQGKTVLHHLSNADDLDAVSKLLTNPSIRSCLNKQDSNGDTPLISAVKAGNTDLCDVYVEAGADKHIKNNEGLHVETETVGEENVEFAVNDTLNSESGDITSRVSQLLGSRSNIAYDTYTEGMPESLNDIGTEYNNHTQTAPTANIIGGSDSIQDTDRFLDMLVKEYVQPAHAPASIKSDALDGLGLNNNLNRLTEVSDINIAPTDTIIHSQRGGNRKFSRKIYKSHGKHKQQQQEESETDSMSTGLSRLVARQSSEIHDRVIKKIMELMNVDFDIARNYKAAIYREVQDEMPNLSSLDRAIEMEKRSTKKKLGTIDIEKVAAQIKAHLAEKQKQRDSESSEVSEQEKKPKKKASKKAKNETSFSELISATSSRSLDLDDILDEASSTSLSL